MSADNSSKIYEQTVKLEDINLGVESEDYEDKRK